MAKTATRFVCQECGTAQAKWSGRCSVCGAWNSLIEEKASNSKLASGTKLEITKIKDIQPGIIKDRIDTKSSEVNQVLGGGIVPGSIMLMAGEPGIGKSTLLLQLANQIGQSYRVLYVSGEESLQQLKLRADRLNARSSKLELATTTNVDDIVATVAEADYQLVIVDSIQTMSSDSVTSAAGTISQITAGAQLLQGVAKQTHTAVLLVGHVTKEGNIAGPKILEHLVDVVLYLEGERYGTFKILRGTKNRFGSTNEIGIFEMTESGMSAVVNPSAALLAERTGGDGSVVLATIEGSRALLVEVQALVSSSSFGYPKRTVVGFDLNRLNLLLAVLGKRAGLNMGQYDVYVNVVGGMKVNEPAADLAVALAVASAAKGRPLLSDTTVFGELGLNGEVRSVQQSEKRIGEAKKLGFSRAIAPSSKGQSFIKPVKTLAEAIKLGLQG